MTKHTKAKSNKRLEKIRHAQEDIESALLTLRQRYHETWADKSFGNLYFLTRLARKAK